MEDDGKPTQMLPEESEENDQDEQSQSQEQVEVWGELLRASSSSEMNDDGKIPLLSTNNRYIVGRAADAHIRVLDQHVSSRHCTIFRDKDKIVWVEDHSLSGTYVNGERVENKQKRRVTNGDSICLLRPTQHQDKKKKSPTKPQPFYEFVFREHAQKKSPCDGEINKYYEVLHEILGSGAYATVRKGYERKTGRPVAIKVVDRKNFQFEPQRWKDQLKEIDMLKRVDHDYCVKLLDTFSTEDALYIVMEFIEGGELFDRIVKNGRLDEESTRVLVYRLLKAVEYLHSQGIVHRDLKPENILLSHKDDNCYHVKVADFGVSRVVDSGCKTFTGSMNYIAPEVFERKDTIQGVGTYDFSCDLWSIGVIVYVCLQGRLPFKSSLEDDTAEDLKAACIQLLKFQASDWKNISDEAKDFLTGLFQIDSTKRLTAKTAMNHVWLRNVPEKAAAEICGEFNLSQAEINEDEPNSKRKKLAVPLFSQN